LLDEIEKAHHDVHELFYQVFDKGGMEDGEGTHVDFKNTTLLLMLRFAVAHWRLTAVPTSANVNPAFSNASR
ncbi:AAA family ATPase, partial [Salmonella enterica subsp. enterica serovar Kentucky]|nr:AAA family ATPase [Salmonella enterica subsp. enterica serovar Kentucky]